MDIVIPYIHSEANELRYALRSICKYQEHDKLLLVGDTPEWYKGDKISVEYVLGRPEFDVTRKILMAIPRLSKDFILWQDDIYKLNSNKIKPVYCDTLSNALSKRREGRFKGIMQNTLAAFPDGYYYGGHTPMIINGEKFKQAVETHWTRDLIPKTMYGNFAGIGGELVSDCKLNGRLPYPIIKSFIQGKDYFSTGHFSMNKDMVKVLDELFPDKCKYEK
jgi:hypothetical protein